MDTEAQPLFRYPRRCQRCRNWIDVGNPDAAYVAGGNSISTAHLHCQDRISTHHQAGVTQRSQVAPHLSTFRHTSNNNDITGVQDLHPPRPYEGSTRYQWQSSQARASPVSQGQLYSTLRPQVTHTTAGSTIMGATEVGFDKSPPPSYNQCKANNISLNQLLQFPNLDVGHLFKTGFSTATLCKLRDIQPTVVTVLAERGMSYRHIMDDLATTSVASANTGRTSPFSFLGFGSQASSDKDIYTVARDLPFSRREWFMLGVRDPSDIDMTAERWLTLQQE